MEFLLPWVVLRVYCCDWTNLLDQMVFRAAGRLVIVTVSEWHLAVGLVIHIVVDACEGGEGGFSLRW